MTYIKASLVPFRSIRKLENLSPELRIAFSDACIDLPSFCEKPCYNELGYQLLPAFGPEITGSLLKENWFRQSSGNRIFCHEKGFPPLCFSGHLLTDGCGWLSTNMDTSSVKLLRRSLQYNAHLFK